MKKSVNEIYELIKQKKENAERDYEKQVGLAGYQVRLRDYDRDKAYELKGEIEAYTDVLCLIESSGDLDDK